MFRTFLKAHKAGDWPEQICAIEDEARAPLVAVIERVLAGQHGDPVGPFNALRAALAARSEPWHPAPLPPPNRSLIEGTPENIAWHKAHDEARSEPLTPVQKGWREVAYAKGYNDGHDAATPPAPALSSTSATAYLRDALDHWLRNGSSIEAADDLRTAAAEWLRDMESDHG